jgi:hypothetical protein
MKGEREVKSTVNFRDCRDYLDCQAVQAAVIQELLIKAGLDEKEAERLARGIEKRKLIRDLSYSTVRHGWISSYAGLVLLQKSYQIIIVSGHRPQGDAAYVYKDGYVSVEVINREHGEPARLVPHAEYIEALWEVRDLYGGVLDPAPGGGEGDGR